MSDTTETRWRDSSSYSRGKPRIQTCWTIDVGEFTVSVDNDHIHHPGAWVMHMSPVYSSALLRGIKLDDVDGAKSLALDKARDVFVDSLSAVSDARGAGDDR
jgi:hypothetical protein